MKGRFVLFILSCPLLLTLSASPVETRPAAPIEEPQKREKNGEIWITGVLTIAKQIRYFEEDYEKLMRRCNAAMTSRKSDITETGIAGKPAAESSCRDARKALTASQAMRRDYVNLLKKAEKASISVAWLKAHFTWVRWGPEWSSMRE